MKPQRAFDGRTKGLIKMLRTKGWTYEHIGKKLYCSRETVRRYCLKYSEV